MPVVEHQRPASCLLGSLAPGDGALGDVPGGRAPSRVALDADGKRRSDRALRDQLPCPDDRGVEQEVLEHLERAIRGFRGGDEVVGFRHGNAHRLLERDDLARVDRLHGGFQVQVVGEENLDQAHFRAREQRVDVVVDGDAVEPPRRRPACGERGVRIAQGHDPRRGIGEILDGVQVGDTARAHDADSDGSGLHVSSAPVAIAVDTPAMRGRSAAPIRCESRRIPLRRAIHAAGRSERRSERRMRGSRSPPTCRHAGVFCPEAAPCPVPR